MSARSSRIPSRTTTLLVVAAAHGLVLWVFWRVEVPVADSFESFASVMFFVPEVSQGEIRSTSPQLRSSARKATTVTHSSRSRIIAAESASIRAQQSPTPPTQSSGNAVDWSAQLAIAAASAMEQEAAAQQRRVWLVRKYILVPEPRDANERAPTRFRWTDAASDRGDTRNWLSTLHLNDHCVLIGFVIPDCAIERIKPPANELEWMVQKHDATLVTAGPNTVPP